MRDERTTVRDSIHTRLLLPVQFTFDRQAAAEAFVLAVQLHGRLEGGSLFSGQSPA